MRRQVFSREAMTWQRFQVERRGRTQSADNDRSRGGRKRRQSRRGVDCPVQTVLQAWAVDIVAQCGRRHLALHLCGLQVGDAVRVQAGSGDPKRRQ